MADEQDVQQPDPSALEHGLKLHALLWPLVGNDLPETTDRRFFGLLDGLGDPRERSTDTNRKVERLLHVRDGLLAAHYHRDGIERIEREIITRIRQSGPSLVRPGSTASLRMPIVGHEYVAFLLACRRTLDYLALGVATCFDGDTYRIKKLAAALGDARPTDLAMRVIDICGHVEANFPDLLSGSGGLSERDRAAHYRPIEPAYLLIVFFRDGRIGIELQDGGAGHMPTASSLDPDRMTRDEPLLSASLDRRLERVTSFCLELIAVAVEAEQRRLDSL
jgi:hypothetical protein